MCSNQSLQKKLKQVEIFFFFFCFRYLLVLTHEKKILPLCTKNGLKIKNNVVTNYKLDILCQISTEDAYKGNVRLSICNSNKLMQINIFGGKVKFTPSSLKGNLQVLTLKEVACATQVNVTCTVVLCDQGIALCFLPLFKK